MTSFSRFKAQPSSNTGGQHDTLKTVMSPLRSEIPSSMCAKLRTVAASNNRVHMPWSLYYCLFALHICMVLFFRHIPFVVNHTFNATPPERLQQHPLLFTTNRTDRTFIVWRLNSARPSHPGHSTILLRSEIPSGMCAKLRTVAASNNRVHMPWSLYYCLFAPHTVYAWCCSSGTSRSWWITHLMQHHRRGCNITMQNGESMWWVKLY